MFSFRKTYQTLNQITINTKALAHNYHHFASINPQAGIAPVLKSNAYGHGLTQTANFIDQHLKPPFIAVDSLYEAYELSKQHIRTPILILGYTFPQNYTIWKRLPFSFGVFDTETLIALNQHQPGAKIHVKLDTGMCRLGIQPTDIDSFIAVLKRCHRLKVEGIYSHLSKADTSKSFSLKQVNLFKHLTSQFEAAGFAFKYKHLAATEAAGWLNDPYFNLIRLGIGFYGYSSQTKESLKPALTLVSHLAQVKTVSAGSQIGYGGAAKTTKPTRIGILPIGYADGLNRQLSNHDIFIGRISMNISTVTLKNPAKSGDPITLIDPNPQSTRSLSNQAKICHTIPYTILTGLNPTIKRIFI
jgi:alanine racemase